MKREWIDLMDTDLLIRAFEEQDREELISLWKSCGLTVPQNDPNKDIDRKLNANAEWLLVGVHDGAIIASAMYGYDGHRGWINYLSVAPDQRHSGIGRKLVEAIEIRLLDLGCPKINIQVRSSNAGVIEFYEKAGFSTDDVISMGKRLIDDE